MGELRCSIFVKSKVSFSYVNEIFFFYTEYRLVRYREKGYEDRATLQELKRCFYGLQVGLLTREQVSRNLMRMPSTSVREHCVVSNIECGDRDVEFMVMLKDIHREVQQSMELKLKFIMLMLKCA
ncbi:hypothetical protein Hanom_Chr16g01422301 [Helianthus anomalus]